MNLRLAEPEARVSASLDQTGTSAHGLIEVVRFDAVQDTGLPLCRARMVTGV